MAFSREKIDELRDLLDSHDRGAVSVHNLHGLIETSEFEGKQYRTYEKSGDVAYVFLGPQDRLNGTITVDKETGAQTFTVRIDP